ncbi:RagB/SusD family nutrient uptake outer membrane protein [Sphingobacterium sp. SYP-B4668]|uniref:RagB/SusD family nutrient uptake outer membrane protein n=1 Tax=Sphingobacterium sp. SYP-B4668 TaxID=2996035 RepID=UPI0022DD8C37|nr:RagB/SusD family nutrient uptake outer membrane protein [Sphingobacterium sp. SYP-B4668]
MRLYTILTSSLIALLFMSCENKLDLTNPNSVTSETFWKTETDFKLAIASCYTPLKNWNGGYYGTRGLMTRISRADDIEFRNDINEIYAMHRFTNDSYNAVAQNIFYQFYNAIYRANSILTELDNANLSDDFKNMVRGEALFIRGMYFFQLAKEFGDVPLRLSPSQDPTTFPLAKSSQADVYAQAAKDFIAAADILPLTNDKGKPTKGTSYAYLGKLYVYTEQWQEAKKVLEPLTKAPYTYRLVDDYAWNFDELHEHNSESIFEILYEPVGGTNQWDNGETANSAQSTTIAVEYAAGSVGGWFEAQPTKKMMNIFWKEKAANGDFDYRAKTSVAWDYPGCMYYQRPIQQVLNATEIKQYWILKSQNSATRTEEVESLPSYINERAMRFADVLLLLAECELESGTASDAIPYIDQIRTRGGNLLPYAGPNTAIAIKNELMHQRAIEFFKEGERFYDLRRWGLLETELKNQDPIRFANFNKRHYYLPIPAKEIQTNPLITQNNDWK